MTTRYCEAMLQLPTGKYTGCGKSPVEKHHRLTRARGGGTLDRVGETHHLMMLCHEHHRMADGGEARAKGLLIDGYATWCKVCRWPLYEGPDEYLTAKYGPSLHLHGVRTYLPGDES